jgi:hypothetical protein
MDHANRHARHSTQVNSGSKNRFAQIIAYLLVGLIVPSSHRLRAIRAVVLGGRSHRRSKSS